jgi:phosphatidylglycerol:prolipoprotein diacylglycerol transferase
MAEGFSLGPLFLRWNGILLALGLAAGALLAFFESKRRGYDAEIVYYLFLPLTVWGTIGARLWHILTPPLSSVGLGLTTDYYLSHPLDSIAIWSGGLGFPGALIGGALALWYFARKNDVSFWQLADLLAPGVALGQAIGRIGNYFNQELYGLPTSLPWKIFIDPPYRLIGFETLNFYHPLFAYETIWSLANLFLLLWLARRFYESLRPGDLFLVYLGFHAWARSLLEFLRLDAALVYGININQVFFAAVFVFAGIGLYLRHRPVREL